MEADLIAWLRRTLPPHPLLKLGAGDDAAALALGQGHDCLVTTDIITDHIDFKLDETTADRIGRKALAVNLSDIAAMAGEPVAAVIGLVLPRQGGFELAQGIFNGILPLAEEYGVAIAGGDTNSWDGPLVVSVTLIGRAVGNPLRRDGARPGDKIIVTGNFGGSILGRHFDFTPRVSEALLLNKRYQLHAGMDVSDGLSLDLSRLCAASGCGARVELAKVPISDDARRLADQLADSTTPLDHALSDGEDFELLLAVPPDDARRMLEEQPLDVQLTCIGEFVAEAGLRQVDDRGNVSPLTPRGYQHSL
jgi:thiamine-monophosphate kinase